MKCPNCGGNNCHFIANSKTRLKGFGLSDACCGMAFLGPIGVLCGLCGMRSETTTKEFWICDGCGSKFSQNEVEKFMKEQEKKIEKFLFYSEVQAQSAYGQYKDKFGERVKEGVQKFLEDVIDNNDLLFCNPPFKNEWLENLKTRVSDVIEKDELIYLIISEGLGLVITRNGLLFSNTFFDKIQQDDFRCLGRCVYLGQTCLRTKSEDVALKIYQFLEFLYFEKDKAIPRDYDTYEMLLEELQTCEQLKSTYEDHFSSQPEYEQYVNQIKEMCMRKFVSSCPKEYEEYNKRKRAYEIWDNKLEKTSLVFLGILAVIALLSWIGGSLGEFLWVLIREFILFVGVAVIVEIIDKKKKKHMEELFPPYLRDVMEEEQRTALDKKGMINVETYKTILQGTFMEEKNNYCKKCYKDLQPEWTICPYCGDER